MTGKFDDIAPLYDYQVEESIKDIIVDPGFQHAVKYIMPNISWEDFSSEMLSYKTKEDFQISMVYPVVKMLALKVSSTLRGDKWEDIDRTKQHLFLSNHRDIVLDAGLLNILRHENGLPTTEIAIGDNLLIHPWIDKLVRLNKSFIVRRGLPIRKQLEASMHLSEYIHETINVKGESVWIAQREGRAKNSDDKTQESLLKMLTLSHEGIPFIESLEKLNLIPLSISYEYDPCDYLKAKEFQLKRDIPDYQKTQRDDLLNMEIGILGQKGRVIFRFGKCINNEIGKLKGLKKNEQVRLSTLIIDNQIHKNYEIFPGNYIAHDLFYNDNHFHDKYTSEDVSKFKDYLNGQIEKIDLENKDYPFLWNKLLEMYSNTLKNYLLAV